jgi:hypothetical protein
MPHTLAKGLDFSRPFAFFAAQCEMMRWLAALDFAPEVRRILRRFFSPPLRPA